MHLLSILPRREGGANAEEPGTELSLLGLNPADYPPRYHRHIATYYELISRKKGSENADGSPSRDE